MADSYVPENSRNQEITLSSRFFNDSFNETEYFGDSKNSDSMFPEYHRQLNFKNVMDKQCESFEKFYATLMRGKARAPSTSFHRESLKTLMFKENSIEKMVDLGSNQGNKKSSLAVKTQIIRSSSKSNSKESSNFPNKVSLNLSNNDEKSKSLKRRLSPFNVSSSRDFVKVEKDSLKKENCPNLKSESKEITEKKKRGRKKAEKVKVKPSSSNIATTIKKRNEDSTIQKKQSKLVFISFKEDSKNNHSYPVFIDSKVFSDDNIIFPRMMDDDDKDSDEELVRRFIARGKLDIELALQEIKNQKILEFPYSKSNSY